MHRIKPDMENLDCEFCRKYQHYGFRHSEKAGKPILVDGKPIPRGRDKPDCENCPTAYRWTDENRKLYILYTMARLGMKLDMDERMAWSFYRLAEEERRIECLLNDPF